MSADQVLYVAGGLVTLGTVALGIYKICSWVKGLNDLVQHELRPNSGSSIKDAQKHQLNKLDAVLEQLADDRKETRDWQDGVILMLGSHEGQLTDMRGRIESLERD